MALISLFRDIVVVTSGPHILVYQEGEARNVLALPVFIPSNAQSCRNKDDDVEQVETVRPAATARNGTADSDTTILGASFSRSGDYFATSDNRKRLIIWKTSDWTVFSTRYITRKALTLHFTHDDKMILVADKTGDVYKYLLNDAHVTGESVLGHLSILMDMLLTPDGRFIVTCDRDEKIRVSCFPNTYNIQAYCMGHTECVTTLSLLKSNPQLLISGSADGTVKFWRYRTGHDIGCINFKEVWKLEDADSVKHHSQGNKPSNTFATESSEEKPNAAAVKKVVCWANVIAVIFFSSNVVSLWELQIEENDNIAKRHIQNINQDVPPWDADFDSEGRLFLLFPQERISLLVFVPSCDKLVEKALQYHHTDATKNVEETIIADWSYLKISVGEESDVPASLYKQWYDNVSEYYERKQSHISKKVSPRIGGPSKKLRINE